MIGRSTKIILSGALVLALGLLTRHLFTHSNLPRGMSPEHFNQVSEQKLKDMQAEEQRVKAEMQTWAQRSKEASIRPLSIWAKDINPQEWQEFTNFFANKAKPAIQRWCSIYGSRAPFTADQITVTNMICRVGRQHPYCYKFKVDGAAADVWEDQEARFGAALAYVATQESKPILAGALPQNPAPPIPPPINQQEILALLKADSGKDYPLNEIQIIPTSQATAMNGGVFVNVHPAARIDGGVPVGPWDYNLVFGPDGKLCYYDGNGH